MKYDDLNYFKMFSLSITQIGYLLFFGFANFVFLYINYRIFLPYRKLNKHGLYWNNCKNNV